MKLAQPKRFEPTTLARSASEGPALLTPRHRIPRWRFGLVCVIIAAAVMLDAFCTTTASAADARWPNIIFILADDLGYGDVGCYGQKMIQTPNIDRFAAEGMRFTQAYSGSTVCAPSRCCLMTGLHTGNAYIRGNGDLPLRGLDVTLAELLDHAGYRTGVIGKWGLGDPGTSGVPNNQGFDYFFGYLNHKHAHNYYPDHLWRNDQRVELENEVTAGVATKKVTYSHDLFANDALDFVEKEKKGPFFLYLAFTIPHANNEARQAGMEVPDLEPYEDRDWPEPQKAHAAMITRMDRDIGRLLKKLEDLGIDERTLILFSSDNGPHREGGGNPDFFNSNGPLRGIKRDLTDGGIRVPFIARWPGKIEAGSTSDHLCAFWDVLPTLTEVAGAQTPEGLDGISFVPTLLGRGEQKQHDYLYWEFYERGLQQAVRAGQWKAIRLKPNTPLELYNIADDIDESNNVAADHPQVVRRMEEFLTKAHTPSPDWPLKKKSPARQAAAAKP